MRKFREKAMGGVFLLAALTSIIAVLLICIFLFGNGIPAIGKVGFFNFITGTKWAPNDLPASFGILPMIAGSMCVTLGAVIVGVPIGIMTSVFMSSYLNKRIYKVLKPATELLAGIPSIVYGFFGLVVIVPIVKDCFPGNGLNILTASILLGIMILPTIIGICESAIRSVPQPYYEGALALGATKERSIFKVVLPACKSGVMAGVILGVGRAIGETMAVIMVCGNQPRMPKGIFKGVRTMTANIVMEMGYAQGLHREMLIATGVVLFVFILLINLCFAILKRRENK